MRILIVDDHPFVRKGIRGTLTEELGCLEIEEAADDEEALRKLEAKRYDLAIFDIAMPGRGGIELLHEALLKHSSLRVLVMSVYPESEFAQRAYSAGAMGYIGKASSPLDFLEAVRRILGGSRYVSPAYAELLLDGHRGESPDQVLSDRELAVLSLFAAGESLTAIGSRLHVSIKTVSTYKARLMEKLQLGNNADLIAYARSRGLVAPSST